MELIIQGSASERNEILHDAKHASVKFAMFKTQDGSIATHLFGIHQQHSHYVAKQLGSNASLELIGAGFVRKNIPEWGSESCRDDFDYDRPVDEPEAEQLVDALRGKIFQEN